MTVISIFFLYNHKIMLQTSCANIQVYCCCFVRRTVAAVPVIGGYGGPQASKAKETLFGMKMTGGQHMEVVKIDNLPDTKK